MALRSPNMVKWVEASSTVTLAPRSGEAYLVKRIFVSRLASDSAMKVMIDNAVVGWFVAGADERNHLRFYQPNINPFNIFDFARKAGAEITYPVARGQTFTAQLRDYDDSVPESADYIGVEYDVYDEEDISPDMPNGTAATEFTYVLYGRPFSAISSSGIVTYDDILNPTQFVQAPFGEIIPARNRLYIHAAGFSSPYATGSTPSSDNAKSNKVILIHNTEYLFNDLRTGWIAEGQPPASPSADTVYWDLGWSQLPWPVEDTNFEPYILPEPLELLAGDSLDTQVDFTVNGTVNLQPNDALLWYLIRRVVE